MLKKVSVLMMTAFLLTACGAKGPDVAPDEAVDTAIENLREYKSMSYDFKVAGISWIAENSINWDFNAGGDFDFSDIDAPIFSFALKGEANDGSEVKSADAEMMMEKMKVYFMINELSDIGNVLPAETLAGFMGQWWSMDLPADSFGKVQAIAKEAEEGPEQEALAKLAEETVFLKDVKYLNSKGGLHRYEASFDKEAWKTYTIEAMKIRGEELTPDTEARIDGMVELVGNDVEIGITKDEMVLAEISGKIEKEKSTDLEFTLSLGDFGESFTIEVPENVSDLSSLGL